MTAGRCRSSWTGPVVAGAIVAAALVVFSTLATSALSQTTVPPGNPEADQYFEAIPDATGDKSIDGGRSPGDVLTPQQQAELEALAPDGVAAAELAAGTAPSADRSGGGGGQDAGGGSTAGGSAALTGDPQGMGTWLWVIIAVSAVAAMAIGVARWRTRSRAALAKG